MISALLLILTALLLAGVATALACTNGGRRATSIRPGKSSGEVSDLIVDGEVVCWGDSCGRPRRRGFDWRPLASG